MDPFTLFSAGMGIVGLGMQIFGGQQQAGIAKQQAQVSAGIAGNEGQVEALKHQQMQLEAHRTMMQNFRNTQRLRAQATASAVNQGANFGSGYAGGQATIQNQGNFNNLGVSQAEQIGNNIFSVDQSISNEKIQLAQLGGSAATAQGISSLGGAVMKAGPIIGAFGKDAFAGGSTGSFMDGGNNGAPPRWS